MSPKPQRPIQAERTEMARLLPVQAERDLPGRRHQLLKDHLMREIRHNTDAATARPRLRYRRRLAFTAIPLAAGAMALALATGGVLDQHSTAGPGSALASGPSARGTSATPAAVLLDRIATVAASKTAPAVRDDQYIHITSTIAYSHATDQDPVRRLDKPHQRQAWLSADGSRPGLLREKGKELKLDAQSAGTDTGPSLNSPTYRYLQSLPTDPDTLLKKIYDQNKGEGTGPDQKAFATIGNLLREQLVPPEVSAALYKAAAKIPGVTVVNDAVDATGRHGIAVARTDDGERSEWIFDKHTLEYLGERGVMVKDTSWGKKGQITATTAVTSRTVTDKPSTTPGDDFH
ncbi:hypothetical protein GTY86_32420 [Streptomyces sp. SID5770]|uniref:CU044_5270 family protein n=1 Tax=Streptomyces sp. SID5770 TaxID=2690308 RepID=UPI00136EE55F|nr:CU044_5270 family protein [Streptomyces sp. SID5770]MZE55901.1 hypothetical protein [Streptomyces sp. SID5770]